MADATPDTESVEEREAINHVKRLLVKAEAETDLQERQFLKELSYQWLDIARMARNPRVP